MFPAGPPHISLQNLDSAIRGCAIKDDMLDKRIALPLDAKQGLLDESRLIEGGSDDRDLGKGLAHGLGQIGSLSSSPACKHFSASSSMPGMAKLAMLKKVNGGARNTENDYLRLCVAKSGMRSWSSYSSIGLGGLTNRSPFIPFDRVYQPVP